MPVVIDEKKYGRLLAKHLPAVIGTDEEHDRFAEILLRMTIPEREMSLEEERIVTLLERLIDDYQSRAKDGKITRLSPVECWSG